MFVLKKDNNNNNNNDGNVYRKGILLLSFFASLRVIYYISNARSKSISN